MQYKLSVLILSESSIAVCAHVTNRLVVQVQHSVGFVSSCVWKITFKQNAFQRNYLAWWFISSLSKSGLQSRSYIKDHGHRRETFSAMQAHYEAERRHGWLKSSPEFETVNK